MLTVELRNPQIVPPPSIAALPRNAAGYPVPWFVADVDGGPDFRCARAEAASQAIRQRLCWICGRARRGESTFVVGPMCAVNRVSSEPPSHRACAIYAARACPFLATPERERRDSNMPDGTIDPPGVMIRRNPGVALVWSSATWTPLVDGLFDIGEPWEALWFARGELATREQAIESIEAGIPALVNAATVDGEVSPADLEDLRRLVVRASRYLPSIDSREGAAGRRAERRARARAEARAGVRRVPTRSPLP